MNETTLREAASLPTKQHHPNLNFSPEVSKRIYVAALGGTYDLKAITENLILVSGESVSVTFIFYILISDLNANFGCPSTTLKQIACARQLLFRRQSPRASVNKVSRMIRLLILIFQSLIRVNFVK